MSEGQRRRVQEEPVLGESLLAPMPVARVVHDRVTDGR